MRPNRILRDNAWIATAWGRINDAGLRRFMFQGIEELLRPVFESPLILTSTSAVFVHMRRR